MTTWTLANGETGEAKQLPPNRSLGASVQAVGDFGGGTLTVEVSNDNANFFPLKLLDGSAAPALTADGFVEVSTGAEYIRVSLAGGSGGSVAVHLGSGV
ncbi:hypothetical protein [Ruegeria lacuscaerulensis]|uniref:hypothetical protein n=1 Tax=Ruegeria lacuscaerulensis TaxID=55218 RepID=UPI00147D19AF|nr:hypothetical protein [Ruegeria lacuscaerulensis]